jgi:hypothetical protein
MMNEPVRLVNVSEIAVYFSKSSKIAASAAHFILTDSAPEYLNYSTETVFNLAPKSCYLNGNTSRDVCVDTLPSFLTGGNLYLAMGVGAFEDFALIPNPSTAIDRVSARKEGSPGKSDQLTKSLLSLL